MTVLPGPDVQILDAAPPAASLTDTGTGFVAGLAERGATSGQLTPGHGSASLGEWVAKHGTRQTYNALEYDTVEAFFVDGGTYLYFSRYAGPAAVKASAAVPAASSKFTATAKGPGASYNTLKVGVAGSPSSVITVKDGTTIVEVSPVLADLVAAQAWATSFSSYIDITPLTTGALADSADITLASGVDDRANVTDTERTAALNRFGKNLGPGQVMLPGDTRPQAHALLAQHGLTYNRFALGDGPDSATAATVAAVGTAARALGKDLARHIQILAPWLTVPGTAPGTFRTIPPCGVHAGLCARNDAAGNPNRAVAGRNALSRFAIAPKYILTDTDRAAYSDAGITPYILEDGFVQPYDDITPVDPLTYPEWLGAAGNRLVMRIVADALTIAKAHMFGSVSGQVDLSAFGGDLKGMLAGWYSDRALYGDTPAAAFRVETGPTVNTPTTITARQLKAALALKIAPNARQVIVAITNTPLASTL